MQHELILNINLRKYLVIFVSVFVVLVASCQKPKVAVTEQEVPKTSFIANQEIPKSWQKIETDYFSFSIPPTMKNKNVKGIDTSVWQYENEQITLSIEQGDMLGDLNKLPESSDLYYDGNSQRTTINGESVIIQFVDLNKPNLENRAMNSDGSTKIEKVEKNLQINFAFPNQQTVFSTESASLEAQEISKMILQSIKFKQK